MDKLNGIISSVIGGMIPDQPVQQNSICSLKKAAVKFLVTSKRLTCPLQIQQIEQIDNQTDLEFFLQQFTLSTEDMLNIYRSSYGTV